MQKHQWFSFVKDEWIFLISLVGILVTSVYLQRIPAYDLSDFSTLYTLLVLFAITEGLQKHHVLTSVAYRIDNGRFVPVKLFAVTFFFSMLVTNDVALLAIVPITLSLRISYQDWVIILEALAANAGSALSPFGNPQNLFLYWHYDIPFWQFLKVMAPFSLAYLMLLGLAALILSRYVHEHQAHLSAGRPEPFGLSRLSYFYGGALALFVLVIAQVLPLSIGFLILLGILIVEHGRLKIDFWLLATFALFFGFTDNLRMLLGTFLAHPHHVFLISSLLSQIISNVPAALLMADFTDRWRALLWGVSVGGFGSIIGSMANLIAYRLYQKHQNGSASNFMAKFHIAGYTAFLIGWILYLSFYKIIGIG